MSRNCVTHHYACDCREENFEKLKDENKKLRECVEETLAIKAHIDPVTYNNMTALNMIANQCLKTLKELEGEK